MPLATSIFFVPCESKDTKANKFVGCLLWSNIPFNFTKHRFFLLMVEGVAIVGLGYKHPLVMS